MSMNYEMLIQFLMAAIWGGLVGLEREYRSKAAGFRTMIMISIGSCFFTMMSILIGGSGNPDRIASNIVTGIGFLGAGVIFRGETRVNGITTAATIWAVAAVGMGIGAGYYFYSAIASVFILIVLAILPRIERRVDNFNQYRTYKIQCTYSTEVKAHFESILRASHLKYILVNELKEGNRLSITWQVNGHVKDHHQLTDVFMNDALAEKVEY
ncbi:MAG: MgtC/SapB family protein [Flavipsychrobacter sp.]